MIKPVYVLIVVFLLRFYDCPLIAQDSTRTNRAKLTLSFAVTQNIAYRSQYIENGGSKGWAYHNFDITKERTTGYNVNVGLNFKIAKNWSLQPELSYYYYTDKKIKRGELECPNCNIPVPPFSGVIISTQNYHSMALQTLLNYSFPNGLVISNGIGGSYLASQQNRNYSYNEIDKTEVDEKDQKRSYRLNIQTVHKIGYKIWEQRFLLFAGCYQNYNIYSNRAIHPFLSLQIYF